MTTLLHRRLEPSLLIRLIDDAPDTPVALTDDHRRSLAARFRAVTAVSHRRLDAWSVEQAGRATGGFHWSPTTARRVIGNGALRRTQHQPSLALLDAVRDEITDQLLRATSGHARPGSLAYWLASSANPVIGVVSAEALNWAVQLDESARTITLPWSVAPSDAYYDVARARTTLRARRDLVVVVGDARVIVRIRSGAPGKSAGPGLRADLTIDALAHSSGQAPTRLIGLWPEAGVSLAVDGTMDDLRAGARDLVRTAVAQRRARPAQAA